MKNWQLQLGFWGGITWLSLMFNSEQIIPHGEPYTKCLGGYTIGFITAFCGYMFWEVVHGRYKKIFGDNKGLFRIISLVPFLVMSVFGLFGFLNGIFNSMPWQYNIAFVVAGIVVSQGVIPTINYFDDANK